MKYTFGNTPTTKGEMVKILKRYGIRTADTADGRTVGIKHLKYEELCVLFDEFMNMLVEESYENNGMIEPYGSTGDSTMFHPVINEE